MFALFFEFRARTRPQEFGLFSNRKRAEISHMNPRRNSSRQPGSCEESLIQIYDLSIFLLIRKLGKYNYMTN